MATGTHDAVIAAWSLEGPAAGSMASVDNDEESGFIEALRQSDQQIWAKLLAAGPPDDSDDDDEADRVGLMVDELNQVGAERVIEWSLDGLRDSDNPWHREVSARVLTNHDYYLGPRYNRRVRPALAAAVAVEPDAEIRSRMVTALCRTYAPVFVAVRAAYSDDPFYSPETAVELFAYADDPSTEVRLSIAQELVSVFSPSEMTTDAVNVLIGLSRDADPRVRDWATFSLGTQSELDTPEIRQALHDRLDDLDVDTEGEAAAGLARRHDPDVFDYLLRRLQDPIDTIGNVLVESAGHLGDERLLPHLIRARSAGWAENPDEPHPEYLGQAIVKLLSAAGPAGEPESRRTAP